MQTLKNGQRFVGNRVVIFFEKGRAKVSLMVVPKDVFQILGDSTPRLEEVTGSEPVLLMKIEEREKIRRWL